MNERRGLSVALILVFGGLGACFDTGGLSEVASSDNSLSPDGGAAVEYANTDAQTDSAVTTAVEGPDAACPSFASFCDDFELGSFTRWTATSANCGGSIVVADGGAPPSPIHGLFAERAAVTPPVVDAGCSNGGAVGIAQLATPPAIPGTFAVRAYAYAAVLPAIDVDFLQLHFTGNYAESIYLSQLDGSWATYTYNANENGVQHRAVGSSLPKGRWFCFEWDVGFAEGAGHISLFVDGAIVLDADDDTLGKGTHGYDAVDIGIASGGPIQAPVDMRYDDVAIAVFRGAQRSVTPRIGCE